jgi:CMP-N-acetylneuraminic acid synthetase
MDTPSAQEPFYAMIPARMGSDRLKKKNLLLIANLTPIDRAIEAAKRAECFSRIYLNSESERLEKIARRHNIDFHLRDESFATSDTKSDDVVQEFIVSHPCKYLAWINTASPLQPAEDIRKAIQFFLENNLDSLITCVEDYMHAFLYDNPINFSIDEKFAQTQALPPIRRLVYSVMAWNCHSFQVQYKKSGNAMFSGRFASFPVSKLSGLLLKTTEDYFIIDSIASSMHSYASVLQTLKYSND